MKNAWAVNRTAMMFIGGFIMLAVLASGYYYVGLRILRFLSHVVPVSETSRISPISIFVGICVFFFSSVALSALPVRLSVKKRLSWYAWLLIGVYIYLVTFFLLSDLVILAGKLMRVIPVHMLPTARIAAAYIVFALVALTAGWGVYKAGKLKSTFYKVSIGKPTSLDKLNVVLIADTHLGYLNDNKWLSKIVHEINSLNPDLVAITGDIFTDNFNSYANPQEGVQILRGIKSKYGVYACLGNHDSGKTYSEMLDFIRESGIVLLQDEHRVVDDTFVVVGRSDPTPISEGPPQRKEISEVLSGIDVNMPVIVLDHSPSNIHEYGSGIDLVLAGHTHAGQMFPVNIIAKLVLTVSYGYYRKDSQSPNVIVTSGTGVWRIPFRSGSSNEIVNITVSPDSNPGN